LYPQGEDVILAEIDESLNQIFSTIQNYFINQATISPDGKWLVLYGGFPGPQVMAFQVGKQEAAILADNMLRDMKKTLWSPDGSLLAFGQHGNSFFRPLSLFNTETEEFTVSVASPEDIVSVPSWSPDGQWLAFTTNQTALSFWNRNDQLVTEILTGTLVSPPLWSPISNQFAVGFVNDNQGKLVVADIDNKNMQEWDIGDDIQDVRVLGWSPDGNWIAFTTLGNESSGLYIAPMQGKEIYLMVDITEGDVIERFVWVPTP
jgi:Tol biopolymer transport system component